MKQGHKLRLHLMNSRHLPVQQSLVPFEGFPVTADSLNMDVRHATGHQRAVKVKSYWNQTTGKISQKGLIGKENHQGTKYSFEICLHVVG